MLQQIRKSFKTQLVFNAFGAMTNIRCKYFCTQGYLRVVKLLVDFSLKLNKSSNVVNSVDSIGSTALHIAVNKNNLELVRYLLTR